MLDISQVILQLEKKIIKYIVPYLKEKKTLRHAMLAILVGLYKNENYVGPKICIDQA
jgi:hypothetical protein